MSRQPGSFVRPELPCDIEERYTVVAELGRGSHAIVYQAHDRVLERDVAIKVLREELVDSQVSERFRREIRLTSRLDHPHIAHVYGTGEWLGAPYFVIALARGPSLADRLARERQLPVEDALAITRNIASALSHAHQAEIVHRDVKPANILLTPDGALLTDFGVARAVASSSATLATSTGTAVGTLLYMSPEQLCAEKDIDARSDQYALALVLYEMLAGVPAHMAANAEGLRALRIVGQHAPLRSHRSSVTPVVEAALDRALSPTPADRFGSMAEFIAAIDGTTISSTWRVSASHAAAASGTAAAATRRVWTKPAVVAGALLVLAASAAALWWPRGAVAPPTGPALLNASAFAIRVDGDTTRGAPIARKLAEELRAWAGISADVDAADGIPLRLRVATIPGGITTSVGVSASGGGERTVQVQLANAQSADPDSVRLLAARVLMATMVSPDSAATLAWVAERPLSGVRKFGEAWAALLGGSLQEAEAKFADAARTEAIPQAALWQAIVASWRQPGVSAAWREPAQRAAAQAVRLTSTDSVLAVSLRQRADGEPSACTGFEKATQVSGGTFEAWYGLGECLSHDSLVVTDAASPTGRRFRSSYWSALKAYELAIDRLPAAPLVALFDRLPRVSMAPNASPRRGWDGPAGTKRFAGLPGLEGDSVVVYPIELADFQSGRRQVVPSTYQQATRRARARLLELTSTVSRRAPQSFAAQFALARSLELAGVLQSASSDVSAVTVLDSAAGLAKARSDSIEIASAQVRVALRIANFSSARARAVGLLQSQRASTGSEAERFAVLAMLVGRSASAESLLTEAFTASISEPNGLPMRTASLVAKYHVLAAGTDCPDTRGARSEALEALRSRFSSNELDAAVARWITRADWYALGCKDATRPSDLLPGDPLGVALTALSRSDTAAVTAILRSRAARRRGVSESSLSWDTRHLEIALHLRAADTTEARRLLNVGVKELSETMDFVLYDLGQVTGLRRSLKTCSDLARLIPDDAVLQSCRVSLFDLTAAP